MKLNNMVAIVTGGASGLGEATVTRIIEGGGVASILDIAGDKGKALVEKLGPDKALYIETDVTDEEQVLEALNKTEEKFGNIHVVINCAGIGLAKKYWEIKGRTIYQRLRK